MNYDHIHMMYDFVMKEYRPNLKTVFFVPTFVDYLKQISCLPSFSWLKESKEFNFTRPSLALDPVAFSKKFKDKCVSVISTNRPEDGNLRVIYQFSPTLHGETALWTWVENNEVHSYVAIALLHKTDSELNKFLAEIEPLRLKGCTEDKRNAGFKAEFNMLQEKK
jgi:hypothetical protein